VHRHTDIGRRVGVWLMRTRRGRTQSVAKLHATIDFCVVIGTAVYTELTCHGVPQRGLVSEQV
jgi:hypothetical protein